ncbi:hypothetical protein [Micromonospora zamorensis]|uniref:hypothetical protein n=1 Tax=Micromonospora zamorensis TaxID=709883 RepID=UPI0008201BBB|nr:hypothetical protein [Micromonospora zamorensis]SCG69563.1 hypothetical protein GA0070619_5975 [Micromonospora zamorensis]
MSDLSDIADGDPRRLRSLRDSLDRLANSPQPELREMARAVLDGEVPLRMAALSGAYAPALGDAFDSFWTYYSQLSPDERSEFEASAYTYLPSTEQDPGT